MEPRTAGDVPQVRTISPPVTYDQWSEALRGDSPASSPSLAATLGHGRVDDRCSGPVMDLIRGCCERTINAETRRLGTRLERESGDADAVALECARYSRACERLLFFTDVRGLPAAAVRTLAGEIGDYVLRVLSSVGRAEGPGNDDAAYCIARLERRWRSR